MSMSIVSLEGLGGHVWSEDSLLLCDVIYCLQSAVTYMCVDVF